MRDDYERERTSFLVWLLSATIAGFVVQNIFEIWLKQPFLHFAGLSAPGLKSGYVWTLVSYPLFHEGIFSLLIVVLSTFFIGREVIVLIGERRMAWLTLAATVTAGVMWFVTHFSDPDPTNRVIGGTSILLCYLAVFASIFPNREISFLVFFVLPVRTRPKYIAWIVLFVSLMGFAFGEIPGGRFDTGVPHSAHLGAMLVGWLYCRYVHESAGSILRGAGEAMELPRWMRRNKKPATPALPAAAPHVSSRENLRAEVDRILDKINSHGFGALTPEEKRRLDDAKDMLSRR
jgi:membrane associated rhomboid family serine protease